MIADNPMVAAALESGEDPTGLCTIRDVVAAIWEAKTDRMEMRFVDKESGLKVNVAIVILDAERE